MILRLKKEPIKSFYENKDEKVVTQHCFYICDCSQIKLEENVSSAPGYLNNVAFSLTILILIRRLL